jgi:hypothetical protein
MHALHNRSSLSIFLCSLAAAASAGATLIPLPSPTPEIPGLPLDAGTAGLTGTVVAARDSSFNISPDFKGTLRSLVVDTGAGYDFYYQLINTGVDQGFGSDIFRIKSIGGFDGMTLSVTYSTSLSGLDFAGFSGGPAGGVGPYVTGTVPFFSADRDQGSTGSVGFDFSSTHFLGDPDNLDGGETSFFAIVRTSIANYYDEMVDISGPGTAQVSSFSAVTSVPEPCALALLAFGVCALARRRP